MSSFLQNRIKEAGACSGDNNKMVFNLRVRRKGAEESEGIVSSGCKVLDEEIPPLVGFEMIGLELLKREEVEELLV